MIRDFTEEAKNELYDQIDIVTPNGVWESIVDSIQDWGYHLQTWVGCLRIDNYLDNISSYHQKILDKNNTSKSEIDQIFENIEGIDKRYGTIFTALVQEMEKYREIIRNLAQIIDPDHRMFTADLCFDLKSRIQNTGANALAVRLKNNAAETGNNVNEFDKDLMWEYIIIPSLTLEKM